MSHEHPCLTREGLQALTIGELLALKVRPSRIQPLQMDLVEKVIEGKTARDLWLQHEGNRFVRPCSLSQREIKRLEDSLYRNMPSIYEDIELSPVAPLGINSVLTNMSQSKALSTVRNVEVLADPASMMAFEMCRRGKAREEFIEKREFVENFCTSARCTRGQVFSAESGFESHFQAFALASGGVGYSEVMEGKMVEHLSLFLDFLEQIKEGKEYHANNIIVDVSNIRITETLIQSLNIDRVELGRHSQDEGFDLFSVCNVDLPSVVSDIRDLTEARVEKYGIKGYVRKLRRIANQIDLAGERFRNISFRYDLARVAGIGYYNGFCYKITASNRIGDRYPLADGGYSDWLAKLLLNGKAVFCSGGFGLELFGKLFKSR